MCFVRVVHLIFISVHNLFMVNKKTKTFALFTIVGTRDNDGYHALHWSCSEGQFKVVELILENSDSRKIYLNEKDDHGRTALHLACKRGQLSVVELLFEKSQELMIDLNATDNMNLTSFHWLVSSTFWIVQILVHSRFDILSLLLKDR